MNSQDYVLIVFICQVAVGFGMNTTLEKGSAYNIPQQQHETSSTAIQNYQHLMLMPTHRQSNQPQAALNSNQQSMQNNHLSIGGPYRNNSLKYPHYVPQELLQQRSNMNSQQTTIQQHEPGSQSTQTSKFFQPQNFQQIPRKTQQISHLTYSKQPIQQSQKNPMLPQQVSQSVETGQYSPLQNANVKEFTSAKTKKSYVGTRSQVLVNLVVQIDSCLGDALFDPVFDESCEELKNDLVRSANSVKSIMDDIFNAIIRGDDIRSAERLFQGIVTGAIIVMKKFEHLSLVMENEYHEADMDDVYENLKHNLEALRASLDLYNLGDLEPLPPHIAELVAISNYLVYSHLKELPPPTYSPLPDPILYQLRHPPKMLIRSCIPVHQSQSYCPFDSLIISN